MESVDVVEVNLKHSGVVSDRLVVVAEFSEAVSPIVEGFHIVLSTKLDFIGVIFNCGFKALKLPVDKASIRVNDGV